MKIKTSICKKFCTALFLAMSISSCAYALSVGTSAALLDAAAPSSLIPSQTGTGTGTGGNISVSGIRQNETDVNQNTSISNQNQAQNSGSNTQTNTFTNQQINDYFDGIISSRNQDNPMRQLMEILPRFGMSFFNISSDTYTPIESAPVAQGYRIGIGDEMTVTLWGIPDEGSYSLTVDRNGMATIPHIGSIRIAGYTVPEAERVIQARMSQYYTGYQMSLSMGQLSSITVYVTGNAQRPGAYTVSSFSTLLNALLVSGGPSATGSLRKIELRRNGRIVTVFDMYAMLLRGDKTQDVGLQAGDVIYIPPVGDLVGLAGEVQTPGVYELNGATRVKDLLYIAGGLNAQTFKGRIQFYRIYDHSYAGAFEGSLAELENNELQDGDILRLYPIYTFAASATVSGALMRPGNYIIVPDHTRISDIIQRAGGLSSTASDIAEITRVTPSLEGPVNERFKINLNLAMMGDFENNMTLKNGDHITVLVIPKWQTQFSVTISGEVMMPGTYSMFPGEKLSDLLTKAGGFTPKAFLKGAVFTRRSVAEEQRKSLQQMADRMERELLESMQNVASGSSGTAGATGALNSEYERRRQLINNLRQIDIMGRVVTKIDTPKNITGTAWDFELEAGDTLQIPKAPLTVNVMGAVYTSSTQLYRKNMSINGYVHAAGGALKTAHKRMVYLLKNDGTTIRLTRSTAMLTSKKWTAPQGFSSAIEPGDTIVVPVKYLDRQPIESLKDVIDVIYKVAIAAGVIIDVTND